MTFLSAWRLWLLLAVAGLAVLYVVMQRRRTAYSLRFTSPELLDSIAPRRPGLRRYLPAVVFLVSLSTLVMAFAQPARQMKVPRERATVIIAIDVSLSMEAADVEPTRFEAAKAAADRFVGGLPPKLNVGVVSFAGTASVLVSPTQDRFSARTAIKNLRLAESTAIGEAIFTSLNALANAPADETGTTPPARIVLLSDGTTTVGRPDKEAIAASKEAEVPVSTIAFGTKGGYIIYDDPRTPQVESEPVSVPVGDDNLRAIADQTGGAYYPAASLDELEAVYADIGSAVGFEEVNLEITDWFVGLSLVLLATSAGFSLLWFHRLP
jgi:Ca-activated chloride channel family protein